jgi:hypothetical protein
METIKFEMDTRAIKQWAQAWKKFPEESGKWMAKFVNDEALWFRKEFPKVIRSEYTIRDLKFIENAVRASLARPSSHVEKIAAIAYTWPGRRSKTGREFRFSGFEEELTGRPSAIMAPHKRVITDAGRKGRVWGGIAQPWARSIHRGNQQRIPSIIDLDAGLQKAPEEHRFAAMIRMMASGKIAHSPSNTFILEGGKYKPGLHHFKGGALPTGEDFKRGKGQVEMIQLFKDKPILPPRWDWQGETADKVREKFTPDYIFDNYIAKAMLRIMPEKKPWPKK